MLSNDDKERLDLLYRFINTFAKSGAIHPEPVIKEIALLTGLTPEDVVYKTVRWINPSNPTVTGEIKA